MAKGWRNPKWQSPREQMDRYLESQGLLNYQTKGMSQEEIQARYQQAGVRVNPDSNWWKDNYKDNPQGVNLMAGSSTVPQGWGSGTPQPTVAPVQTNLPRTTPINFTRTQQTNPTKAVLPSIQSVKVASPKVAAPSLQSTAQTPVDMNAYTAPDVQTDWKAQDFDFTKLSQAQKVDVLKDPNFNMYDVKAAGQQGLILSDSTFKLFQNPNDNNKSWWERPAGPAYNGKMAYNPGLNTEGTGYGIGGDLQWWQPLAYTALSNPKTQPVAQAAAMTLITGGEAAPIAGLILVLNSLATFGQKYAPDHELSGPAYGGSYDPSAKHEYINPFYTLGKLAEGAMQVLNFGAQTMEQVGGSINYLTKGKAEKITDSGAAPLAGPLLTAGAVIKSIDPERISSFISDPSVRSAVWKASKVFYETHGLSESTLHKVLEYSIKDPVQRADTARAINAFLPLVKDQNQVWVLGEAAPQIVKPGYTLDDAVNKILKDGYSTEQLMQEYQQIYGLSGVASDFMLQAAYDPMNVLPGMVSEGKAKIMEARNESLLKLGELTPEQAARVEINKIKADVYRDAHSVNPLTENIQWSETARKLRASIQEAANTNPEILKTLTPWERRVAGLTPDGKIAELLPTSGLPKWIDYVMRLTPDAKARLFQDRGASVLQSLFDFSKGEELSPKQTVDILKATANADMETLSNAGAEFMSSPEAYTVIGEARDFIPEIEKRAAAYENTADQRARVLATLEALGGDKSILKDGLKEADWNKLKQNPGALEEGIKNGTVTLDSLKKDVEIFRFKKDGTTKADLSVQEFNARVAAAFDDHVVNWGKDYFGIRKVGQFEEGIRALKGLQSLMLLDLSPTSIMNDLLNERVMLATQGTLGLTDNATITQFMDEMGVVNRENQSAGGMGDSVKSGDNISNLTRGEGALTKAADTINKFRKNLLRSKVTGVFNEAHQLQIRYSEMKKFMTRNWMEGKAFDRMPPSLEAKLSEYGYDPQVVYQNLRSTFKPEQIEVLKERATTMDVNTFLDQSAATLGKDPAEARVTLEQLGVMDQLKTGLEKAQTMEQRAQVFDNVQKAVVDSIDIRLANQLRGILENARNKIKAEGPAGVVQIFQEIPLDYFERKIENDTIWDDAFTKAAEVDDYTVKNAIKSKAARDNQTAWKRTQARQATLYIAAIEGLDLSHEFGRDFMTNLADEQKVLQKFFEDKNTKAQALATRRFKSVDEANAAWDNFTNQFNERFASDQRKVLDIQKKRNAIFSKEMGRMYGQPAEAMAVQWMDAVMNNSDTMHKMIVDFRQSLQGLSAEERAQKWKDFKPEYQASWRERMKVDMHGAGNLYKWDENPPIVQDYIDRANADIQAAETAKAERRAAIRSVADEFGFQPNTRDDGYLQFGILRKAEYGGIPDLKGFSDERLTPERMREILTKRAEIKAAEAALQPELPTQPAPVAEAPAGTARKIGANTNILKAIQELGGISKEQAKDILGERTPRGKVFTDAGRGVDEIARLLVDEGYPIDLERPDDIGGIRQTTELIQRAAAGEDVFPVTHSYDNAINREAKSHYEQQRLDEIQHYSSEADAIRAELDTFDYAAPDASAKAIALQERQIGLYDAPESIWDTAHNDATLLDSFNRLNEEVNKLVDDTSTFDRLLDSTFRAHEDVRTMETHGEGISKRDEIHTQLKDTFGEEQGSAIAALVDTRADRWAAMTGRTREEWYAANVAGVNKDGGSLTELNQMNPEGLTAKGGVNFDQFGRATITAMKSADASTGVHEFAHVFLEDFRRMADEALPEHAQSIRQDLTTFKDWTSIKQEGRVWKASNAPEYTITEQGGKFLYQDPSMRKPMEFASLEEAQYQLEHEMFARGFEKYMYEGRAPVAGLAALFERFATWMREIYRDLTGKAVNVDISPAMRDVFNRLLTDYDRVEFDTGKYWTDAQGAIRPKESPYGLLSVNKKKTAQEAGDIVNPEIRAKVEAERAKMPEPTSYVWQYPYDQYAALVNSDGKFTDGEIKSTHRVAVEQAFHAGRDVPEEVLAEYPYLTNPDATRYNTPEAQTRRTDMAQREAMAYYENKRSRDQANFYQNNNDNPTLPPGGYDQHSGYMDVGKLLYDGWLDEVKPMMDEMKKSAMQPENRYNFAGMDEQTRKDLNLYLAETRGRLATTKNAARRWGDEMVDFNLLDYRRQYGFDKLFSAVVPYEFYGVRSAANWFTRILDRPGYLTHFARIQNLHNTYESQLPERMRGKYFLPMPFLPDWAGDGTFIDPKYAAFPWTQYLQPLEALKRQDATLSNNATYILRDMVDNGTITQEVANAALASHSGTYWDKAIEQAKIDQGENLNTGADYFSMLFGPALYLTLPYYLATGKKMAGINSSYPSGQLPITRVGQGLETAFKGTPLELLGNVAGLLAKPEQYARKQAGLPEFGEWGDYYIDRQLANMAAEGADPNLVQMAMIERKGDLYQQAEQRVREEMMMRIPGMAPLYGLSHGASFDKVIEALLPSLFPGGLLPPAEMEFKGLKSEYNHAWDQYNAGNKQAISKFFDDHPEYQARLALRRDPQERLEQFLKSQIWDTYGNLEATDKKTAVSQMDGFNEFLSAEPGQTFAVEKLAQWAQQLGGMVPNVKQTAPAIERPKPKINYYDPRITRVTDQFFEERKRLFPDYYKEQAEYYALTSRGEKQTYLVTHPNLKAYFNWKGNWYDKYPQYVPVFNGEVFKNVDTSNYPPMLLQMIQMYALTGEAIPGETKPLLEMAWIQEGRPYGNLDTWIEKDLIPTVKNDMMQGMVQ